MSIVHKEIASIREEYSKYSLTEEDIVADPIQQFEIWFEQAISASVLEPNAMALATLNNEGFPVSRIVLLKDIKPSGFSFFTNYESSKGKDILTNNKVSVLFFWPELQRQVRIEGVVEKLENDESDEYFASRPRGSRLGAIASPQSTVLVSREKLEERVAQVEKEYEGIEDIPRPLFWGGYQIKPVRVEFWQGRTSRLHDRLVYTLGDSQWIINRIAP